MNPTITLDAVADLSEADQQQLAELRAAVYSPEEIANWPGRHLEWSPADSAVRISEGEQLVSHVGIVIREARFDQEPVNVGGIGGVKTHPNARRKGYAAMGIARAVEFFQENDCDFGLLVCEPRLIGYYSNLGWREFTGDLYTTQRGGSVLFTFNPVMTIDVCSPAPEAGTIDLGGPPW